MQIDEEPFNPDFTVAERVLDMATQEESNGEVRKEKEAGVKYVCHFRLRLT